ncbi:zinc ribbon domain-containing protein [Mycolicibacterium rufum]|uniref:Zinc ribbon domain-containing protein n=1 Tax=Mycolicibacterium rufum TaxID=318424 RepID=A0A9X2YBI9_9MYCO|nr:zinc ribbon domain-containing protein [Mycolicibacterium rufum]KGI68873.1 zinc-ribbon domain protein [Mycolicibacterium rufum]MCV7070949.1 zinc ribbon domain-containing protein [Mycolicibacterium rufum]ULP35027.1 zinc ribbon domain-containing protein [Mycolicibacterium rufum]
MTSAEQPPVTECRICRVDVPAGDFCGLCGCHLTPRKFEGPDWLRIRNFGAAPGESLLSPSLVSSLFPQLNHRGAFRVALGAMLVSLVAFALLRMPAALIAVGVLGLPTLFLIYLREADAFRDLPPRVLALTAVLGIGLGVGFALLSSNAFDRSSGFALGVGMTGQQMVMEGVAIPLGGAVLMLTPVVVIRLIGPPTRESLEGFMIGALGALTFTAAAMMTRLVPQLDTGLVSTAPLSFYLVEAGIRGVAVPLISAASGGLIGAALWFVRPDTKKDQHPGVVRALLVFFAVAILLLSIALGLVDISRSHQWLMLALYTAVAVVAVLLLRISLHLALLHEAHDEIAAEEPVLCQNCGHVVPDMAFCPACGVAARASSRSSRALRRTARPQPVDTDGDQP